MAGVAPKTGSGETAEFEVLPNRIIIIGRNSVSGVIMWDGVNGA